MTDPFLAQQVLPSLRTTLGIASPCSSAFFDGSLYADDLPPPSYAEATKIPPLAYVDFPPKCISEGGILTAPVFERFHRLVSRANVWLQKHTAVVVRSLETVDFETNEVVAGRSVDTSTVSRFGRGQHGVFCLKVLRIWLSSKGADDDMVVPQQFGYVNVVPACVDVGGVTRKPHFDSLDATIDKLNAAFAQKPLPGNVVAIERISMKFRQHCTWVDAERCHYHERHEIPACQLYGFRVFYVTGLPTPAMIGFQDFIPSSRSGKKTPKDTEGFSELVAKADAWISQNCDLHVTNFQTLHVRRSSHRLADINKALTVSYRSRDCLQILRIWFQQFPSPSATASSSSATRNVSLECRTFHPLMSDTTWRNIYVSSAYESLKDVAKRMADWLMENTAFRVVSAETSCLKIDINGTISDGENTFVSSDSGDSQSWIRVLRIYYLRPTVIASPVEYEYLLCRP